MITNNEKDRFEAITNYIYAYGILEYDRALNPTDETGDLKYEISDAGYAAFNEAIKTDVIVYQNFNMEFDESGNYRVFDPYQKHYRGYINPDGWSNWSNRI
jgi:hypothetical protein